MLVDDQPESEHLRRLCEQYSVCNARSASGRTRGATSYAPGRAHRRGATRVWPDNYPRVRGSPRPYCETTHMSRSTRPLVVAGIVCAILVIAFTKQLQFMGQPDDAPWLPFLWLPALGVVAGAVLAFGPAWPSDSCSWAFIQSAKRRRVLPPTL